MDQSGWSDAPATSSGGNADQVRHQLEGIQELPENVSDNGSIADPAILDASAFISVIPKLPDDATSPILGQVSRALILNL